MANECDQCVCVVWWIVPVANECDQCVCVSGG